MNIRQLPKGTEILSYDKLSKEAQAKARIEIFLNDIERQSNNISKFKKLIKLDINACVNDNVLIPTLNRIHKHIDRINKDQEYCERYITENVCNFTAEGNYITYMS